MLNRFKLCELMPDVDNVVLCDITKQLPRCQFL